MIPFQRPQLPPGPEIERYLGLSREERWFSNGGPCWKLLRNRLSERVDAHCVPVANGTLGLMAALAAARGERRGGTALMPSFTFAATALAASWAGLSPRLADIEPDGWHLDPGTVEATLASEPETAAVVAVSAFGTPPPAATRRHWERACERAGVPLIVDSAAGFGAIADDGTPIGRQGDLEVVSFHATKPFAIGEGGAVFTRDRGLSEAVERIVNFGFGPERVASSDRGLNAKMSELHAATALAVLDRFDEVLARRREFAGRLRDAAGPGVAWQTGSERSTWQFTPIALSDSGRRARLIGACRDRIEVRAYYEPLDRQRQLGATVAATGLARTADLADRILSLPMANDLDEEEIETIGDALASA